VTAFIHCHANVPKAMIPLSTVSFPTPPLDSGRMTGNSLNARSQDVASPLGVFCSSMPTAIVFQLCSVGVVVGVVFFVLADRPMLGSHARP